jgi:hypothetical protein
MYMKDSIKYGGEGGKDFGCAADKLTPQARYRSSKTGYIFPWQSPVLPDGGSLTLMNPEQQ